MCVDEITKTINHHQYSFFKHDNKNVRNFIHLCIDAVDAMQRIRCAVALTIVHSRRASVNFAVYLHRI